MADLIRMLTPAELASLPFLGHYVQESVAPSRIQQAWALGNAALWITPSWPSGDTVWATALGEPNAVLELLALVQTQQPIRGATLERKVVHAQTTPTGPSMPRLYDADEWDWWRTTQSPAPREGEAAVRILDLDANPRQRRLVQALLDVASPEHWAPPGHRDIVRWFGIVSQHRIVACVAETQGVTGHPHLASVATHPEYRGRGFAKDVVAAATRAGFVDGAEAVSLGMHASNDAARAVYSALGFKVEHAWISGALAPPAPTPDSRQRVDARADAPRLEC